MRYIKKFENIELTDDIKNFIKWCLVVNADKTKNGFAYNEKIDKWLNLRDFYTRLSWDELYAVYLSQKYNL